MNRYNDIVYPIVGRMLNPDNFYSRFIGNATSTQAYNRYSYVVNNPLKYTDPSGWKMAYYEDEIGKPSENLVTGSTIWQMAMGGVEVLHSNFRGGGTAYTPGWTTTTSGYSLKEIINRLWNSTPNGHDMTYFFENGNVVDAIPGAIEKVTYDSDGTYYEIGVWLIEPDEHGTSYYGAFYAKFKEKTYNENANSLFNELGAGMDVGDVFVQVKSIEQFGVTAQQIEKLSDQGKFMMKSGKVYSLNFFGNQSISSKIIKNVKSSNKVFSNTTKGLAILGVGFAVAEYATSDRSGGDKAHLVGSLIIAGTAAIPVAGPFISAGLGIADSFGAFDFIYNKFE